MRLLKAIWYLGWAGVLFLLIGVAFAARAQVIPGATLGKDGDLNGYRLFQGSAWTTPVDTLPVDPISAAWVTDNGGYYLHPDFDGQGDGIPYTVVDSTQTGGTIVPITVDPADSDINSAPIPSSVAIEGGTPQNCLTKPTDWATDYALNYPDHHAIAVDLATGYDYEYDQLLPCNGFYSATSSATWDVTTGNQVRPWGMTSVDAAGLSVLAGLVRYDEAYTHPCTDSLPDGTTGQTLCHAIRFTLKFTHCDHYDNGDGVGVFVLPATHAACNSSGFPNNIMGMRIRMKANIDLSSLTGASRVIGNTMKKYGMILADNGSNGYFSGTDDPRWTSNDANELKAFPLSDFEVVQMGTKYYTDAYPTGTLPTNTTPVAAATTVPLGRCTTVTWTSSGSSYDYLENGSPSRNGTTSVCPIATTTYKVQSNNEYGRTTSAPITITVLPPPIQGGTMQGGAVQ